MKGSVCGILGHVYWPTIKTLGSRRKDTRRLQLSRSRTVIIEGNFKEVLMHFTIQGLDYMRNYSQTNINTTHVKDHTFIGSVLSFFFHLNTSIDTVLPDV